MSECPYTKSHICRHSQDIYTALVIYYRYKNNIRNCFISIWLIYRFFSQLQIKIGEKCAHCGKQFKVTTGTIYDNSNILLQKWFLTFYLILLSKKGISSIELSKTIGVTQKWLYLLHKVCRW